MQWLDRSQSNLCGTSRFYSVGSVGQLRGGFYDNAHDGHHRHYYGAVEPIDFVSFEDIEHRFEQDWITLRGRK